MDARKHTRYGKVVIVTLAGVLAWGLFEAYGLWLLAQWGMAPDVR